MRHLPRRLAPIAVVGLLALGACSPGGTDAEFDDAGSTADATPKSDDATTDDATGAADDGGTDASEGTAGVDFPDPEDVVADATFTVPGTEKDEVRIGVESIVVSGGTMELRLVVTPEYDDGGRAASVYDAFGEQMSVALIDRENLKEYQVLEADGGGRWYRTDPVYAKALPGQSVGYQSFFAAPEDDVTTVDVKLTDSWPVFEDVPLTFED